MIPVSTLSVVPYAGPSEKDRRFSMGIPFPLNRGVTAGPRRKQDPYYNTGRTEYLNSSDLFLEKDCGTSDNNNRDQIHKNSRTRGAHFDEGLVI